MTRTGAREGAIRSDHCGDGERFQTPGFAKPLGRMMDKWRVHKFGGSSVADAACMQRVADILEQDDVHAARRRALGLPRRDRRAAGADHPGRAPAAGRRRRPGAARAARRHGAHADSRRGSGVHRRPRSRLPGHRRDSSRRSPDALGLVRGAGSRRRFRGDLVDAPVRALPRIARPQAGTRHLDRRARHRPRRLEPARTERALGRVARQRGAGRAARRRRDAGHHRLHRAHGRRAPDDARQKRQRLLRVDLRRPARRGGDRHLDRRGRRAERRPAPRPRRHGHRFALVSRGDGAGLLRREGHSSADDGAGGGEADPDLDPEHVRAGEGGDVDLRTSRRRLTR